MLKKKIRIEVSARHIHLHEADFKKLFGRNHQLVSLKRLSQIDEFASRSTVDIKNNQKIIKNVRVIGPARSYTQVEISKTDAIFLGLNIKMRVSGDVAGTPGLTIIGPKRSLKISQGIIIAHRHIHLSPTQAKQCRLKNKQQVKVRVRGERGLVFENVLVRVRDGYDLSFHIDTDEANAAGVDRLNDEGELLMA